MKIGTFITSKGLELQCLIIEKRPFITGGFEALCYAQNRLFKGYIESDDNDFIAELRIVTNFVICPEWDEQLLLAIKDYE